jgi:hypothetical protein
MICVLHQVLLDDQIEKSEMSVTYGTYGRQGGSYRDLVG